MNPGGRSSESAFWRFSLAFYALPGVAPACLRLQDEGGADVNLMLFLLFLAKAGRTARAEDIRRIDAALTPWREGVVKPLRTLRRALKDGIEPIDPQAREGYRNQIKKVELEAERLQQTWLEREAVNLSLAPAMSRAETARLHLAHYAAHLGGLPEAPLKIVLDAFTNAPP